MTGARPIHTPDSEYPLPSPRGPASVRKENQSPTELRVVSPVGTGHKLGEGAAIFTDMRGAMLTALDQQMALSDMAQKPEGPSLSKILTPRQISSHSDSRSKEARTIPMSTTRKEVQLSGETNEADG